MTRGSVICDRCLIFAESYALAAQIISSGRVLIYASPFTLMASASEPPSRARVGRSEATSAALEIVHAA